MLKVKRNNIMFSSAGWRDVDGNAMSRTEGKNKLMDELFSQVKHLRPPDASELKGIVKFI